MRKTILLFVMIFTVIAGYAQEKEKQIIYPEASFDSLQAKTMLEVGTATIEGRAFTKPRSNMGFKAPLGEKIYASNATVVLIPVTPYFEAWHDLRKKKAGKKTVVYMSQEAYRWRLESKTDGEGHFTFKKMKPGRYFLQVFVDYDMNYTKSVYTGSGYSNYGRTDYYAPQSYSVAHSEKVEEYVEVKEGDDIVKVKLK